MNEESVVLHVGVAWERGLRALRAAEGVRRDATHGLFAIRAAVDIASEGRRVFVSDAPLAVVSFVVSLAHQLALALAMDTGPQPLGSSMGSGPMGSSSVGRSPSEDDAAYVSLRIAEGELVLLSASGRHRIAVVPFQRALRRAVHTLLQDVEDLPVTAELQRALSQLHRADDVLAPSSQVHSVRRLRRHAKRPSSVADRWSDASGPSTNADEPAVRAIARGDALPPRTLASDHPPPLARVAYLRLEHANLHRLHANALDAWAFLPDGRLALTFDTHVILLDPKADQAERIDFGVGPNRRPLRYDRGCVFIQDDEGAYLCRLDAVAAPWMALAPTIDTRSVRAVLRDATTIYGVWVGDRLLDPFTGEVMLDRVADLYASLEVGSPYAAAARSTGSLVFLDHGRVASEVRVHGGAVMAASACKDGVAIVLERAQQTVLRWYAADGSLRWERRLTEAMTDGGGYHGDHRPRWSITASSDPTVDNSVTLTAVHATGWWCFRLDLRSFLPMLVLQQRTDEVTRVARTARQILVATHRGLTAFPLSGNQPAALWDVTTPLTSALSGNEVPLAVRGDLVTHMQDDAVVRDVETGEERARYRDTWASVLGMVMDDAMALTVLSRAPNGGLEVHHARPRHWLGLVQHDDTT